MAEKNLIVRGAREHNLKNITVEFPRNKLIVITGLSGSGKSTLAFDTIYAEGQRRYVESLSAYARQFLGIMNKPDIDSIEGLSPAISIEQKTTSKNPRSTVGTVTEIYDYFRLLFARIGVQHCPKCFEPIRTQSAENIVHLIMTEKGKDVLILAPILDGKKGTHEKIFEDLKKDGFTRVRIDGELHRLDDLDVVLERYEKHWIEAVVDRVTVSDDERLRISEAVEQALTKGNGVIKLVDANKDFSTLKEIERQNAEQTFSTFGACPKHQDITFKELEPRYFSFNAPYGACPDCNGIGEHLVIDENLLIPDQNLSIMDGALSVYGKFDLTWRCQQIAVVGKQFGFDVYTPLRKFTAEQRNVLLYGTDEKIKGKWSNGASMNMEEGWEGVIPQTMRLHKDTESNHRRDKMERLMTAKPCHTCKGKRLRDEILAVHINHKSIIDVTDMNVTASLAFFEELNLSKKDALIAQQILKEIKERLGFLHNVGLTYLSLSRSARTLSGGEAQRIRLATQIGSNLMGVLYVLDEPSIGLHQRDNQKLIATLHKLRDLGNTLIVVEHDEETMKEADYLLDIGPGAGVHGGHIVAQGTPQEVMANEKSLTGRYLLGLERIETPKKRREATQHITIEGCSENNLQNVSVDFPTGILCGVTGVSGSGKSTLMNQTLIPSLRRHFGGHETKVGKHKKLKVPKNLSSVIVIDQEPIGRTPRSNPATYTKLFDDIRTLFASVKEAKIRGYKPGRFSFNVPGGRCETCRGDGLIKIEMNFLPDVYVECEECKGKRYNKETLQITYKGKNIADILAMTVEDALPFFAQHTSMMRKVQTLSDVGLEYITLGQSATTLSGGESQRIKLTRELAKFKKGNCIYLLDEPTTGLHFADVKKLLGVLHRLVEQGNSIYVIEHNLEVIKCCDYVIDLGPEGGTGGGKIIVQGTPEQVARCKESHTGHFLKEVL